MNIKMKFVWIVVVALLMGGVYWLGSYVTSAQMDMQPATTSADPMVQMASAMDRMAAAMEQMGAMSGMMGMGMTGSGMMQEMQSMMQHMHTHMQEHMASTSHSMPCETDAITDNDSHSVHGHEN